MNYAGVDGAICKVELIAKEGGIIEKEKCGIEIQVKDEIGECVNEVKRIGYLKDRGMPVQMRVGDSLFLYISTSNA